jgi:hypothetical protein
MAEIARARVSSVNLDLNLQPTQFDTGSCGAAAPGPSLITERDRRGTATRAEKIFGERLDGSRVIALAAENVEVGVVRIVCKMAADQRSRDQLHHGITCDAAGAEIDDLALAKTLHVDELAQLNDIAADMVGISNQVGMAILEIDGGTKSPRLPFTHHVLGGNGSGYWGLGWKDRGLRIRQATHRVCTPFC